MLAAQGSTSAYPPVHLPNGECAPWGPSASLALTCVFACSKPKSTSVCNLLGLQLVATL